MAKARILIVEDDRFYLEFYRDILEKEGFKVGTAQTAKETIKRLKEEPFDMVIADFVLKGVSGLELLSEIKKEDPKKDVIMVTSMQSIRKAVDALKLGASDYLTKPVDKDELLLAVKKVLERQVVSTEQNKLISENIHFYEMLRIQKKNLFLLSTIDMNKLQDVILDTLINELNAPGGLFFIRDRNVGNFILTASRGIFDTHHESMELDLRTTALRKALENGSTIMESKDGDQWIPKANDEGMRLMLPIPFRRDVLAVVKLVARRGERPYGSFDVNLGRHILEAAGIALVNAINIKEMLKKHIYGTPEGTYTPSYFRSSCDIQIDVAKRYGRPASLLLMKLANYDTISRKFKENQLNLVINHICKNILELIRETDLLSRLDEDLFGILVPETDFYGALMLKKRIKAKLSKTSYPLDMKRDMVPVVYLGCSACPRDDNSFRSLLEIARRRLLEEKDSLYPRLNLNGRNLWGMVKRLIDPSTFEGLEKKGGAKVNQYRSIKLTEPDFQALTRNLLKDIKNFYDSRGLIYLGVGTTDPDSPIFAGTAPDESFKVSVFALGARGNKLWNLPHITPVFVKDPALAEIRFILGITECFSYALFCHKDKSKLMKGFHTSDNLLVLELLNRLQERYLLQRRIG